MPHNTRAFTRAIRARMKAADEKYIQARDAVLSIREYMNDTGESYEEAEAWFDDPRNKELCEKCGWTVGMICPECPGCGCYNGRCTGWRHEEYMHDDEREASRCGECGADPDSPYHVCNCG